MTRGQRRQLATGAVSALALAVILLGPPAFLSAAVGWPLPTTFPSLDEIKTAITVGVENDIVVKGLALVAWVAWALLALSVAAEIVARVRGRATRVLPGVPGALQAGVGRLVASATLAVTSVGPLAGGSSVLAAAPVIELVAADPAPAMAAPAAAASSQPLATGPVGPTGPAMPEAARGGPATPVDVHRAGPTLVVGRHDSYWAIAERILGDPLRWSEIRDLNAGRTMPDGTVIPAKSDHPLPGWQLVLPADAQTPTIAATDPPAPAPVDVTPTTGPIEVTVEPGDNMWQLAENHLAEAGQPADPPDVVPFWLRFIDTNRTRLADPDNPNLIYPGQDLVFLTQETEPPTTEPQPAESDPATSNVDCGPPTESAEASRPNQPVEASDAPRPTDIEPTEDAFHPTPADQPDAPQPTDADATGSPQPSHRTPVDPPDASEPTDAETSEASQQAPAEPSDTPPSTDVDGQTRPDRASDEEGDQSGSGPTAGNPVAIAITGMVTTALAAGVVEGIRRRRRRANYQQPDITAAPSSNPALHQALAAQADGDSLRQLRHSLDQLAVGIAAKGHVCRPRIVQQGPDHLDVLLDQPTQRPPDGWDVEAEGRIWVRTADGMAADRCGTLRSDHLDPTPLLVALGAADDSGQLYLDLEAASVVALTGDRDTALGIARSFVAELANSPMAEAAQIIVVGELGGSLHRLDRVVVHEDWNRPVADLTAWADGTREALADAGWPNSFIGRSNGVWADALRPLVVVAATPPDDTTVLDDLLAASPASAAVVVVGEAPNGALTIDCTPDQLELPQLGLTCQPRPIAAELASGIADLLDHATGLLDPDDHPDTRPRDPVSHDAIVDLPGAELGRQDEDEGTSDESTPPEDPLTGTPPAALWDDGSADLASATGERYEDPPHEVLVRVLGDIEIEGTKVPPTPKQTAILTYLALHGSPDGDRLTEALWATSPGTGAHRKRLGNAIGECRRILDSHHLPPATDGRYQLGPAVLTDTDLWDHRVKAAANQPPEAAAETLQGAIALVRGPVFAYRNADQDSYAWVDIENLVAIWEKKITGVTQHLAELYLDLGQPERAVTVAETILRAIPTDTAVTETLMRAHAANGDLRSLKRVYQAHVNALEHLDLDHPAESTTTLFDDLRRNTPGEADGS